MENLIIIKPKKRFTLQDLKEIWIYKELLYFFTWRDLKVRYKQTVIGVLWAIFRPFITMVVFSVFFGGLIGVPSDDIPYPIFVYVGLLFWQLFSASLSESSNSLVSSRAIFTKIYFPRLILPISSIIPHFVDFLIASLILIGMMFYYHFIPSLIGLLIIPILILITLIMSCGLGIFLSAVNVKYRDVPHVLPFLIQTLMFVTPVIYPTSILQKYSWIMAINPMTGVIQTARAAMFGTSPINWMLLLISSLICLVVLIIGIIYFKKTEKQFADLV